MEINKEKNIYTRRLPLDFDRRFRLNMKQRELLLERHNKGEKPISLAESFGVSVHTVYRIISPEKYNKKRKGSVSSKEKSREAMRRLRAYRRLIFRGSDKLLKENNGG